MTTMQTQAFLDWLKADTGDGWHRYLRVDLKALSRQKSSTLPLPNTSSITVMHSYPPDL